VKYFFSAWGKFSKELKAFRYVFLFLDYDGTLTPIVKMPQLARISRQQRALLKKLAGKRFLKVCVISGRALPDIKRLVDIKSLIFAGNHGMEVKGPKISYLNKKAVSVNRAIKDIYNKVSFSCASFKGAFVENKGLTLSVHFRNLKAGGRVKELKENVKSIIKAPQYKGKLRITEGKKVIEIRPNVAWDKGKAVRLILKKSTSKLKEILPVYIGDDITDEDAFFYLRKRGTTIFVGSPGKKSRAKYYLKNTSGVYKFLNRLYKAL